jgi:hypothetical protein
VSSFDDFAPGFRAAAIRWPDAPNLAAHYKDVVTTFDNGGASIVELCKSFIEMVCITILQESGETVKDLAPTTEYLRDALAAIGVTNTRGSDVFDKVLSAHNKLSDALAGVRNHHGSVAHGRDGFLDRLESHHARMYVVGTDTILSLLLSAYDGVLPSLPHTREPHEQFEHLNQRIDTSTGVQAIVDDDGTLVVTLKAGGLPKFDLRVQASQLLFYIDRRGYVDVLDAVRGLVIESELDDEEDDPEVESTANDSSPKAVALVSQAATLDQSTGQFNDKLEEFAVHLAAVLAGVTNDENSCRELATGILHRMEAAAVIDWQTRSAATAKVRVLVKKAIKKAGLDEVVGDGSKMQAIHSWLSDNIEGG